MPKSSSTPRKRAPRKTTTPRPRAQPTPQVLDREALTITEEERQAKISAYTTLKSAGVPVPPELAAEVEAWIEVENQRREIERAEYAKYQAALEEENTKGPWYIRNGYTAPFSLRLDRQHEQHARRIELKPRGVPGDMYPIIKEDLQDPLIQRNCSIGVIEIIPAGEAKRIAEQQNKNAGTREVHVPTAILRNSLGDPVEFTKTEIEWNAQGVTVATLDPNQMQGGVEDKRVQVTRVQPGQKPEAHSQFIPTDSKSAIVTQQPMSEMARLKVQDDIARRKGTPLAILSRDPKRVLVRVSPSLSNLRIR